MLTAAPPQRNKRPGSAPRPRGNGGPRGPARPPGAPPRPRGDAAPEDLPAPPARCPAQGQRRPPRACLAPRRAARPRGDAAPEDLPGPPARPPAQGRRCPRGPAWPPGARLARGERPTTAGPADAPTSLPFSLFPFSPKFSLCVAIDPRRSLRPTQAQFPPVETSGTEPPNSRSAALSSGVSGRLVLPSLSIWRFQAECSRG